jgi:hypothetical protein
VFEISLTALPVYQLDRRDDRRALARPPAYLAKCQMPRSIMALRQRRQAR